MKNLSLVVGFIFILFIGGVFLYPRINDSKNLDANQPKIVKTNKPEKSLKSFKSQKELDEFLASMAKKQVLRRDEMKENSNSATTTVAESAAPSDADDSITNVQHAGVDEGGIVKLHGDHLIILRRGRLFTVSVGDNTLQPIASIDAFAPDINPSGTWYDEMLISGNTIAVIGYSYQRGGTEIGVFNINNSGGLSYRSTYHLRSNDYYSSRNYASRLIGSKLIFYTPLYLGYNLENPMAEFPALRKWRKGATEKDFRSISSPTRIYKPVNDISDSYGSALHTVTVCNLDESEFKCEATSVIGPAGRVFYVSPKSVYVWTTDWRYDGEDQKISSMLYQMPLDGSAPTAIGVSGSPVDQFSFLESDDDYLNVLVRSAGNGDGMWNAEVTNGDVALLRVPRGSFGDGNHNASNEFYQELPKPDGYSFQNKFIGDYLIYGSGSSWEFDQKRTKTAVYAVRWRSGESKKLPLEHGVDRIEGIGNDAVIVGTNKNNLYFSPVELSAGSPNVKPAFTRKNAVQGEERSHGFFYKPENSNAGFLGLPIIESGNSRSRNLNSGSASILFLHNEFLRFSEMGTLNARSIKQTNDRCRASCVDWYGNARPLFIKGRVFALLGYEIVEGIVTPNGIKEKRRNSFLPAG